MLRLHFPETKWEQACEYWSEGRHS